MVLAAVPAFFLLPDPGRLPPFEALCFLPERFAFDGVQRARRQENLAFVRAQWQIASKFKQSTGRNSCSNWQEGSLCSTSQTLAYSAVATEERAFVTLALTIYV